MELVDDLPTSERLVDPNASPPVKAAGNLSCILNGMSKQGRPFLTAKMKKRAWKIQPTWTEVNLQTSLEV